MRTVRIKTTSDRTYAGKFFTAGTYYTITYTELIWLSVDIDLLSDVTSGVAIINDGSSDITDANIARAYLQSPGLDSEIIGIFTPTNYTRTPVASESIDKVSAHLRGIDNALGSLLTNQGSGNLGWMPVSFFEGHCNSEGYLYADGEYDSISCDSSIATYAFPKPIRIVAYSIDSDKINIGNWYIELRGKGVDTYPRYTFEKINAQQASYGVNESGYATYPAGIGLSTYARTGGSVPQDTTVTLWYTWASVPYLSNNVAVLATATASSTYSSYVASKINDKNITDYWKANSTTTEWVKIDFGANVQKIIKQFSFITDDSAHGLPKNVKFQASNDNTNWTDLKSWQTIHSYNTWQHNDITNSTAYQYYRFYVTDCWDSYYIAISEILMHEWVTS